MTITVLLVDDEPEVRQLIRRAMRFRGGFDVVGEAADGPEAVALAASTKPDVVVLDLVLPGLAGQDVLTQIRQCSPRSKVVVFSGAEPHNRRWLDERVEGFVLKDAELGHLLSLLEDVSGPASRTAALELPRDLAAVHSAREFARVTLDAWGLRQLDSATLVVSEFVANAISHADSACQLRLSLRPGALRVEVYDDGTGMPEPRPRSDTSERGRGLYLVDALTVAWGVDQIIDDGKCVWADLVGA